MASSSSTVKFRAQNHKKKKQQLPLTQNRSTSPPQGREEDSPMTDFLDLKLAHVTKQEYIRQLQRFFDFLQLHGDLDKQSRAFLTQARTTTVNAAIHIGIAIIVTTIPLSDANTSPLINKAD